MQVRERPRNACRLEEDLCDGVLRRRVAEEGVFEERLGRRPLGGVFGQTEADEVSDFAGHQRVPGELAAERRRRTVEDFEEHLGLLEVAVGQLAGGELGQRDAESPDVGLFARPAALDEFGGEVERRAFEDALALGDALLEELAHGEGEHLDLAFGRDEDVRGLDVVDDGAEAVEVVHVLHQVLGDRGDLELLQSLLAADLVRPAYQVHERAVFEVLQDDVEVRGVDEAVVHGGVALGEAEDGLAHFPERVFEFVELEHRDDPDDHDLARALPEALVEEAGRGLRDALDEVVLADLGLVRRAYLEDVLVQVVHVLAAHC